jgi:hypothetical protein
MRAMSAAMSAALGSSVRLGAGALTLRMMVPVFVVLVMMRFMVSLLLGENNMPRLAESVKDFS